MPVCGGEACASAECSCLTVCLTLDRLWKGWISGVRVERGGGLGGGTTRCLLRSACWNTSTRRSFSPAARTPPTSSHDRAEAAEDYRDDDEQLNEDTDLHSGLGY